MSSGLVRYFFKRSLKTKLPRLHLSLKDKIDLATLTEDERLILQAGIVRDQFEARRLLTHYQAASAPDLFPLLPKRRLADFKQKLAHYWLFIAGGYPDDPNLEDYKNSRRLYG